MVDCHKCGTTKIYTKEKTYFCPDCNQLNKKKETIFIESVGSFDISAATYKAHTTYLVEYQKQHGLEMYWTFINDLEMAKEFALLKTKTDKKLFR